MMVRELEFNTVPSHRAQASVARGSVKKYEHKYKHGAVSCSSVRDVGLGRKKASLTQASGEAV